MNVHSWDIYLSRCVSADELLVDFPGLGAQLGGRLCVLVVLASQIECDIFLAILRRQERSECTQSFCTETLRKHQTTLKSYIQQP